jgi:hypothetical protein
VSLKLSDDGHINGTAQTGGALRPKPLLSLNGTKGPQPIPIPGLIPEFMPAGLPRVPGPRGAVARHGSTSAIIK